MLSAAAGLWVAVILLSVLWLVPINNRLIEMPDFGPTAQVFAQRFQEKYKIGAGYHAAGGYAGVFQAAANNNPWL